MALKKTTEIEKNLYEIEFDVDKETFEAAIEKVYRKEVKKINVPGFRKGKAPRSMIERMYGKGVFLEDAANDLISESYEKALDECTEDIVSSPKIDVIQLESGKPFIYTAEVALKPEVTLGKYKGVKIDKMDIEVTEEEIEKYFDNDPMKAESLFRMLITKHFYEMINENK